MLTEFNTIYNEESEFFKEIAMDFETVKLSELENSDESTLEGLPFGIVRSNTEDHICNFYNKYESDLAGLSADQVLKRNFYVDVAPCTNNFLVYNRFVEEDDLDDILDYVFTYNLKPTKVKLRLLKQKGCSNEYLLVLLK